MIKLSPNISKALLCLDFFAFGCFLGVFTLKRSIALAIFPKFFLGELVIILKKSQLGHTIKEMVNLSCLGPKIREVLSIKIKFEPCYQLK